MVINQGNQDIGLETEPISSNSNKQLAIENSPLDESLCRLLAYTKIDGDSLHETSKPILNVNQDLNKAARKRVYEIIRRSYLEPTDVPILPSDYSMSIKLTNDTPFHAMPRRLSFHERAEVQKILDDLLTRNIIQASNSPYASAVVLVKKKNGETRMCVDFRTLNKVTARDNYPLPLIEDCIGRLGGKSFLTSIDMKDGFFLVPMAPESTKYTAFVVPHGQFEYLRMPFGLKNAPAVFQRFISEIFHDLIVAEKIKVYIDDIIIATKTLEEHYEILEAVLRRITERGLTINLAKCHCATYHRLSGLYRQLPWHYRQ